MINDPNNAGAQSIILLLAAQRADEYASAQRIIRAQTRGLTNANARIRQENLAPSPGRKIVLELITGPAPTPPPPAQTAEVVTMPTIVNGIPVPAPPAASTTPSGVTPASFSAPGGNDTSTVAFLSFDVSLTGGDGFMQRISYRHMARQSIHQTAKGFYVDEFNISPGRLVLNARVIFQGDASTQVKTFLDLLYKAKMTTPMSPDVPKTLLFHDIAMGRSLVITQNAVEISVSADEPNIGTVTIEADILKDYGQPQTTDTPNPSTPVGNPSDQISLLTFQSPSGSDVALASNVDVPTIGTA